MGSCRSTTSFLRRHARLSPRSLDLRRIFCTACLVVLSLATPSLAAGPSSQGGAKANELESLREATRVLEEEIKLAARPQLYLLLDLSERVISIKGRGVELHRLPIMTWRISGGGMAAGAFRLRARPSVVRPTATPGDEASQDLIELQDMPAEYALAFDPSLTLFVAPPVREQPLLWAKSHLREWWTGLASWTRSAVTPEQKAAGPRLRLTLSQEAAQSLAWSVAEGMPLLIRSTVSP